MNEIESMLRRAGRAPGADEAARRFATEFADAADAVYATLDSPVGPLVAVATGRGLVRLAYSAEDSVVMDVSERISPRILEAPERLDEVRRELDEYFDGARRTFSVPIDWRLTHGFTRNVLRATARIPFGEVSSYKEIAGRAGSDRAYRAAGNALGSNPIPIVVPCHRVLHSGGGLGGYTGGLERKRFLLTLEGVLPGP
jgi:methylated-DNA-[protein]-cysteine S-methyltransferase